jgi:hypothetical protein
MKFNFLLMAFRGVGLRVFSDNRPYRHFVELKKTQERKRTDSK